MRPAKSLSVAAAGEASARCPYLLLVAATERDRCGLKQLWQKGLLMNMRSIRSMAGVALLATAALTPMTACAATIYDARPVLVRPMPLRLDCPTCYKGHDFGSDCFQFVWNGFEQVWTNVCLLGWH